MKVIQTNILKDVFGSVLDFQNAYYEVNLTYDELYDKFEKSKSFTENVTNCTMQGIGKVTNLTRLFGIEKINNSDWHFRVSHVNIDGTIEETWIYVIKEV